MDFEEIEEKIEKPSEIVIESRSRRRDDLNKSRELHRISAFNKNRFLESEILNESDIKGLCGRIKRRKHCTEEDLEKLSNAFFQCENNIIEFLKITGAINILVKEILGTERQLMAAQCLCNLSLGDEISCHKVATFAGCYLMMLLKNLSDVMLIKILIWTLENLITSGDKALDTLMSQELLKSIIYIINNVSDVQIKHEALHTLDIIIDKKCTQMGDDELLQEVIKCIFNHITKCGCEIYALQIFLRILRTGKDFAVDEKLLNIIIEYSIRVNTDEDNFGYAIEILTILAKMNQKYLKIFLENLLTHKIKLSDVVNSTVSTPKLYGISTKFLTLIGIIITSDNDQTKRYLNFDDILSNLKVPKMLSL